MSEHRVRVNDHLHEKLRIAAFNMRMTYGEVIELALDALKREQENGK